MHFRGGGGGGMLTGGEVLRLRGGGEGDAL